MPINLESKVLTEGKTKIVFQDPFDLESVLIKSKSTITAGDGLRKDVLEDKDIFATNTTANVFKYLNQKGIKTHYIGMFDNRTFIARKCKMFQVEIIARRIAFGSYLKRNLETQEGKIFREPIIEFFLKDDDRHDPFMKWNDGANNGVGGFDLYDPKKPLIQGALGDITDVISLNIAILLEDIAMKVFLLLEEAWQNQGIVLVDLKIECGIADGKILVADVIDNDSWRIWPFGNKNRMLDKQVYRNASKITPEVHNVLKKNYAMVAEMTGRFL